MQRGIEKNLKISEETNMDEDHLKLKKAVKILTKIYRTPLKPEKK